MSGEKYKTISESEYNRLRREAMAATTERERARALERLNLRLAESAKAAERTNAALSARINSLNSKIDAAKKDASDLKKKLYDTVDATNKAMEAQRIQFEKKLADTHKTFADVLDRNNRRIEQVIEQQGEELRDEIADVKKKTAAAVATLHQQIGALAELVGDPNEVVSMAQDHLDVAQELLAAAAAHRHALLLPGQYEKVADVLKNAKSNVALGAKNKAAASAALISGQTAFDAAKKFYDDVIAAETEWAAKLAFAMEALASAEARINANSKMAWDKKEQDVDFWSNSGLTKLQDLTEKLREQLENPDKVNQLTCQDLEDIAANAQLIADDADQVLTGALLAITGSDQRIGLAVQLAKDLRKYVGMETLVDHGYEGNDQRASNMIHLKNSSTGFEAVITLIPELTDGKCGWRVETRIVNPGTNAQVAADFDKALTAVAAKHGLQSKGAIPLDTKAAEAVADWGKRTKVQVPAIATPGADQINKKLSAKT